ncbi:MAG: HEPN domain-containing protein [Dehalococcoidia bacterium]|jgi:HEPN domain-containing protein
MSLEDWLNDKLVVKHRPSAREIAELLHICDRDLEKAGISELGPDWRLSIAHNAAVQAARAALAAVGYRARKEGHHYLVLQSLALTIRTDPATIKQLDKLREKRNISDYERAGLVTEQEAEEMIALAKQLRDDVERWLRAHYPSLAREI